MDRLNRSMELLRRWPNMPYPGLRPFLDHEAMLLHGRDRQIDEVIERLIAPVPNDQGRSLLRRFVAVLGGSGSGKSSLIRAGVIPKLRQGIPELGDLWESVVCTPGSDFVNDTEEAPRQSPITRLAWEFDAVLTEPAIEPPPGASDADVRHLRDKAIADRRDAIAEMLRQPGGLDRVVEHWSRFLSLPGGGDPQRACILVVIDQFEELFHASNRDNHDVAQLISRVIDHYHLASQGAGCDRCFVALTMRSEHLQDCAAYIGLPDAINTSAYLISRLDKPELHAVIEAPAQRFLKLQQRLDRDSTRLPETVRFTPDVTTRLIDDTLKIVEKPDHLPLLQHLLARIWQQAMARVAGHAVSFPQEVTKADLVGAVYPPNPDRPPLEEEDFAKLNVLEASLQEWAQHEFEQHSPTEQAQLTGIFRKLAYKDPRNGSYTQQRLLIPSDPVQQQAWHQLLDRRWIHSVNYLFWDDRNADDIRLKVSHESFLRGWKHVRDLIDEEALRFERFQRLLTDCSDWLREPDPRRKRFLLMDEGQLQRMTDSRIPEALFAMEGAKAHRFSTSKVPGLINLVDTLTLASDGLFNAWRKLRPYQAAPSTPPELWHKWHRWLGQIPNNKELAEVKLSGMRDYYQRSQDSLATKQVTLVALALITVLGLIWVFFSIFVQQPVINNANMFIEAADKVLALKPTASSADRIGGNAADLRLVLNAVEQFYQAKDDKGLGSLGKLLPKARRTVEQRLNNTLRLLLTQSLWLSPAQPGQVTNTNGSTKICGDANGYYFPGQGGGLLITRTANEAQQNTIWNVDETNAKTCQVRNWIKSLPPNRLHPEVVPDAELEYLLMTYKSLDDASRQVVTVAKLVRDGAGSVVGVDQDLVILNNDAPSAEQLRNQVGQAEMHSLPSQWVKAGRLWQVGSQHWRIVSPEPTQLPGTLSADRQLVSFPLGKDDPSCKHIQKAYEAISPGTITLAASLSANDGQYCLSITQSPATGGRPASARLVVHAKPLPDDISDDGTLNLKGLPELFSTDLGATASGTSPEQWRTGEPGSTLEGWLVFQGKTPGSRIGIPWSTRSLMSIGEDILAGQCEILNKGNKAPQPDYCSRSGSPH